MAGKKLVLDSGSLKKAVAASTCIPGVFEPVRYNNTMLVDGGVVENVPISPLKKHKADRIIAVSLNTLRRRRMPENIVDILVNSYVMRLSNTTIIQMRKRDILIRPDLSSFNLTSTKQVPDLIERGHRDALAVLKRERHKL
jgi:NTE family protein